MVISVLFSVLGLTLGAGLIIDFVSVRDGLIIVMAGGKMRTADLRTCGPAKG